MPAPTPELGRIAATWAAWQAIEWNQWALELWRATEEKRADLVALRQSEETLHQVWRRLRPLGRVHRPQPHPLAPRAGGHPGAQQRGAGKLSATAVASKRGSKS